jgi:hypothetical protein
MSSPLGILEQDIQLTPGGGTYPVRFHLCQLLMNACIDEEDIELLRNLCFNLMTELAEVRVELQKAQDEAQKRRKDIAYYRSALNNALIEHGLQRYETDDSRFRRLRKAVEALLICF